MFSTTNGIVKANDLETDCKAPLQYSILSCKSSPVLLLTAPYSDGMFTFLGLVTCRSVFKIRFFGSLMKPLSELKEKHQRKIKILFFDLDGTFISNDSLKSSTYRYLEKLRDNKIKTVVVTGRPAGWCDLIARWWPVNSVIGENGALSYSMLNGKMDRQFYDDSVSLEKSCLLYTSPSPRDRG